ncbi:MAG: hypothetical protein ACD_10C00477G0001 [uncultured bacterium]|nr:MAG: hypothetical protein ACD_10C00477G0001 [uncultured bacterium]
MLAHLVDRFSGAFDRTFNLLHLNNSALDDIAALIRQLCSTNTFTSSFGCAVINLIDAHRKLFYCRRHARCRIALLAGT